MMSEKKSTSVEPHYELKQEPLLQREGLTSKCRLLNRVTGAKCTALRKAERAMMQGGDF